MHSVESILARFPYVEIHPSVVIYAISCFEAMHDLSLDVSVMLKECL